MIKENYYPFKMEVILKGYFGVKNAQSDIKFFEKNASGGCGHFLGLSRL